MKQDKLFSMLMEENEITWQNIIYDLVKTEQMNPWDIDISILSQKYLEILKKLKEMNFSLSGKVILASAILLKIKSKKLVEEDLARFESILNPQDDDEINLFDEDIEEYNPENVLIMPKTPQPRKRKVSVYDLVSALERALTVNQRRIIRHDEFKPAPIVEIPEKKIDINKVIKEVYDKVLSFFSKSDTTSFSKLVLSDSREDKIYTFVPLLHLENQRKLNLHQESHFGEIEIKEIN